MKNENGVGTVVVIIILVMAGYLWSQHNDINKLREALSSANSNIEEANSDIDTANSTIEELNSQIENAKGEAWSDYDSMGQALDDLSTGETINSTASDVPDPTQKQ